MALAHENCIPLSGYAAAYRQIRALIDLIMDADEVARRLLREIEDRVGLFESHVERAMDMVKEEFREAQETVDLFLSGDVFKWTAEVIKDEFQEYVDEILAMFEAWHQTRQALENLLIGTIMSWVDRLANTLERGVSEIAEAVIELINIVPDLDELEELIRRGVREVLPVIC